MPETFFFRGDPVLICLVLVLVMIAAGEVGFLAMRRVRRRTEDINKSDIALFLGAVLTLLSLLLGFTYVMSQGRYETRRQLVINEAEAIRSAYFRAGAIPEPRSSEVRELLRRYLDLRLEMLRAKDTAPETIREVNRRSMELQNGMEAHATALAKESPNAIVSLFVQSLDALSDIHTKRLAAVRSRVPAVIYWVLVCISVIVVGLSGVYFGTHKRRLRLLTVMFSLLVASVMWLILDLDSPALGTIRASQQSLVDLQQEIGPPGR